MDAPGLRKWSAESVVGKRSVEAENAPGTQSFSQGSDTGWSAILAWPDHNLRACLFALPVRPGAIKRSQVPENSRRKRPNSNAGFGASILSNKLDQIPK